jgi:hypothetical protein
MRKGEPLIRLQRETEEHLSNEIFQKCIPGTYEVAALWKQCIERLEKLGPNPPDSLVAELDRRFKEGAEAIRRHYAGFPSPAPNRFATDVIFGEGASETGNERGFAEYLHWLRHKTPLWKDLERQEARNGRAAKRVLRTASDFQGLRCDHKRPKGFKGDLEHSNMFDLLWGFGVENLTPEALAYFFECFCPCGGVHDPDNLRKQRERYSEALAEATGG